MLTGIDAIPALPPHLQQKEDAKPPLHALSGLLDGLLKAMPVSTDCDQLVLGALLYLAYCSDREDKLSFMAAIGYLML